MKLFFELQGAQTEGSRHRGIGRYTRDLITALGAQAGALNQIHLGWNHSLASPLPDLSLPPLTTQIISAPYGAINREPFANTIHDIHRDINDQLLRQRIALCRSEHVLFSSIMEMDSLDFVLPKNLNFAPFAISYSIAYDIIPYIYKDEYFKDEASWQKYLSHLSVKTAANFIFSISETTRQDLISRLNIHPDRIITIGTGIDSQNFRGKATTHGEFIHRFGLTKPFALFMGGGEFRKNLIGLTRALRFLPEQTRLNLQVLVVGKITETKRQQLADISRQAGLPGDMLVFAEFLAEPDLLAAYQACTLTVIPSIYEGFGLPALEAMAYDAPVIASRNSSFVEIFGTSPFLFDPLEPEDIADKITFTLNNAALVKAHKASYPAILAQYDWKGVAERIVQTFEMAQATQRNTSPGHRMQNESLEVVVLGALTAPWRGKVLELAALFDVTVYGTRENMDDLETLPLGIYPVADLSLDRPRSTPVICMALDADSLARYVSDAPLGDHLIIAPRVDLRLVASARLRSAHRLLLYDQKTIVSVDPLTAEDSVLSGEKNADGDGERHDLDALNTLLSAELHYYRQTHPYLFAEKLRKFWEKRGKPYALVKKIGQAAAVARFGNRPAAHD